MVIYLLKKIHNNKQFVKYAICGSTAASVDLFLLFVFTDLLNFWIVYSASLAFVFAFFVSFYLQKFWTFRDNQKKGTMKQMIMYLMVGIMNLGINAGGMYLLVEKYEIMYLLAQIIMGLSVAIFSFSIYRFVIFRKKIKIKKAEKEGKRLDEKKRILIATGIFPPDIGGPATYAKNLRREFKNLGYEVKVVTYGEKSFINEERDLFAISRNQNIFSRYFKYFWKIYRLLDWADIFYALDLVSAGLPAVLVAKLKNKKAIFRTGGDFLWEKAFQAGWTNLPLAEYYPAKKNFKEKILLNFSKWVLKNFDLVIFSTDLQKNIYKKYYGLRDENVKLIPNALPQISAPEKNIARNNDVIFAGRLIKLKNIDRLIKVFSEIKNKDNRLLIFGKGPQKNELEKKIIGSGQAERIKIMDSISHGELLQKIYECGFVILPSVTEISPNLALECISMGKPLLLTKYTGLDEKKIKKVITIDPMSDNDIRDKIEYLLDPANLSRYEEELRKAWEEKREWRDVAGDHVNIFKNLNNKNE